MQLTNFALLGIIEGFAALLVICGFLVFYARNLKGVIKGLQEKLGKVIGDLKATKAQVKEMQAEMDPASNYLKQINDQLLITRSHHESLEAGQDIALDLNPETPKERHVAAFRHALLIAEKEALHASDSEKPDWQILEGRLGQLIDFYRGSATATEDAQDYNRDLLEQIQTAEKRIENLEKFKKLYFDMEGQWAQAKSQAQDYFEQLSAMAGNVSETDKASFESVLENYHQVYDGVSGLMESGIDIEQSSKTKTSVVEITQQDNRSQEELRKLRNVAAEQHEIIAELQKKLQNANTLEEKDSVIYELNQQLERQTRFVQESETCIQLLEDELNAHIDTISKLQSTLDNADDSSELELQQMKSTISQFTQESKDMLKALAKLEQENEQLADLMTQNGDSNSDLEGSNEELKDLKKQYAELEERYLELKMQSI